MLALIFPCGCGATKYSPGRDLFGACIWLCTECDRHLISDLASSAYTGFDVRIKEVMEYEDWLEIVNKEAF